ncbi:hypothetical protein AB4Y43_07070 [Paraburkholderia sp. BR10872]|uniref:hypothetical protein n=1 Tax=Paraburkholderia sp. BR10872 TaxID=3236989 RepID=UPI0034D323E3
MAAALAHELRSLANTLDAHAAKHSRRRSHLRDGTHQRGAATIAILSTISFVAATYINDIAWLDAALSIGAQLTAAALARRSS